MAAEVARQRGEAAAIVGAEVAVAHARQHALQPLALLDVAQRGVALVALRLDLIGGQPEEEEVLLAHLLADLDVGPVEGAHGQRAVHGELHVPGARGLHPRQGDLLRDVGGREDALGQRDAVVGQKDHLDPPGHGGVVVDDGGHVVDQLDLQLGRGVARRRLAGEDEGARHHLRGGVVLDPPVEADDVQAVEQLALVLVDPLDLHVEDRVRVHQRAGAPLDHRGQVHLVAALDRLERRVEPHVVDQRPQPRQLVEVRDPRAAQSLGDHLGQARVGEQQPAPRRDAVGLVVEALGEEAGEVGQQVRLDQLRVQLGHAVDAVRAHHGQVRHAHLPLGPLLDDRGPALQLRVPGRGDVHVVHEAVVDLEDDLHVPRQQALEERDRPALQRLGQQRVVGVGRGLLRQLPGPVPGQPLVVEQHPHQLCHGDGGVGVVELDRHLVRQLVQAVVGALVAAQDVVDRGADEEVLLLQAQLPALGGVVLGVEHLGDALRQRLLLHRASVVPVVEDLEVEVVGGLGRPEPQVVDRVVVVAGHRHVVGHGLHLLGLDPAAAQLAVDLLLLHAAVKVDRHGALVAGDLPDVAQAQPGVGVLHLPAVLQPLLEDAELIADAVAVARQGQRGHGVEEAGRQAAQAAVAQARIGLVLQQPTQVDAVLQQQHPRHLVLPQIDQVQRQRPAEQKLRREVVGSLDVLFVVGALGLDPAVHQAVARGQRYGVEDVRGGGRPLVLGAGVVEVVQHGPLQRDGVHAGAVVLYHHLGGLAVAAVDTAAFLQSIQPFVRHRLSPLKRCQPRVRYLPCERDKKLAPSSRSLQAGKTFQQLSRLYAL